MSALDWGYSTEETVNQLMEVSSKARKNGERYAIRTAGNAAAAVERKGQRQGRGLKNNLSKACGVIPALSSVQGYR